MIDYKFWADKEIAEAVHKTDIIDSQHARCLRILNHIHVVDRIFLAHMKNETHGYTGTNTENTPSITQLVENFERTHFEYQQYLQCLSPQQFHENIKFRFTDGSNGTMSRREMLMHIMLHGAYHRGAVGEIVNQAGGIVPRDLFAGFLHLEQPLRRDL
jgi:uncharacterized damage-inducible protein DinB